MSGRWVCLFCLTLVAQQPRDLRQEPLGSPNSLGDRGGRYALVIGISRYQHLPPGAQLRFADRDADEFASFLRSPSGGALPADHVRLLTNEQATLASIRGALHFWLVDSAGPDDLVYMFFAGHGVLAEREEAYFVAYDTDPQNLHATAVSFDEVDQTLSERLRANLAILAIDACHSGRLGWTTYAAGVPSRAEERVAAIGRGDRSFLKLLASRTSERSFEDERWNGGHGVFTHALLEGLRGSADTDRDLVVRASELIDYIGRVVPDETQAQQHPRVAGTFDARLPLAAVTQDKGRLAADDRTSQGALAGLQQLIASGRILETNGAWDFFRAVDLKGTQLAAARASMAAALEEVGQACVSDYVQSTQIGPKKVMLGRASEAFERLRILRPKDAGVSSRAFFCQARLQIAESQFEPALVNLQQSLRIDPQFACAYNAMGVALERLSRLPESGRAFEMAARLAPEWALPPFQIGMQFVTKGDLRKAVVYFEQASRFSPGSIVPRWNLVRAFRLLGSLPDVEREAAELIRRHPTYAPAYLELARAHEAAGDNLKAASDYETYLLLAPNYADSDEIRTKVQQYRSRQARPAARPTPTLRRPGER